MQLKNNRKLRRYIATTFAATCGTQIIQLTNIAETIPVTLAQIVPVLCNIIETDPLAVVTPFVITK